MTIEVRQLQLEDKPNWMSLWRGYLEFYESPEFDSRTESLWLQLLDPEHDFECSVATLDGDVVGIAQYFPHIDTWFENPVCYLNDLFVAPEARGRGIGRILIEEVNRVTAQRGWQHVYLHTHIDDNDVARALYDSLEGVDSSFMVYELPPAAQAARVRE